MNLIETPIVLTQRRGVVPSLNYSRPDMYSVRSRLQPYLLTLDPEYFIEYTYYTDPLVSDPDVFDEDASVRVYFKTNISIAAEHRPLIKKKVEALFQDVGWYYVMGRDEASELVPTYWCDVFVPLIVPLLKTGGVRFREDAGVILAAYDDFMEETHAKMCLRVSRELQNYYSLGCVACNGDFAATWNLQVIDENRLYYTPWYHPLVPEVTEFFFNLQHGLDLWVTIPDSHIARYYILDYFNKQGQVPLIEGTRLYLDLPGSYEKLMALLQDLYVAIFNQDGTEIINLRYTNHPSEEPGSVLQLTDDESYHFLELNV
jgi:hypothetical protein